MIFYPVTLACFCLNPLKDKIITREIKARIVKPRLKPPPLLSSKRPKAEGPA